ncbi:hypothetical protein PoB_002145300 [Plakobranchus ocellatus]|uniref:Uncharacterized protein n=1 Tax=Plakobranchus ocellatus TaxID=259542 RepID=A0AAV3ZK82_9GAST|nr:hypothetical protein PoB_002145300 [Plakobranchus ocellatus]
MTKLRMAVRFSKPVRQLWLKCIKRFPNICQAYASAVRTQLRIKLAALPKEGGRSVPAAPPKGKKAQKDSPALSSQRAAKTETKRRP